MGNVEVAWEDVISVLQMVRTHLIVIVVALICMIVAMIFAHKLALYVYLFCQDTVADCIYCGCGGSDQCHASRNLK